MQVPTHLHLSLFCLVRFQVWTREGRAWVEGAKDDIDLDYENVQELIDLGLAVEGETRVRCGAGAQAAFNETFSDRNIPSHPGL